MCDKIEGGRIDFLPTNTGIFAFFCHKRMSCMKTEDLLRKLGAEETISRKSEVVNRLNTKLAEKITTFAQSLGFSKEIMQVGPLET